MKTKFCIRCSKRKDVGEFHKNKTYKNGLNSWCKKCMNEYSKKYYIKNKEYFKNYQKMYYQKNREKIREYYKKYYQEHKKIKEKRIIKVMFRYIYDTIYWLINDTKHFFSKFLRMGIYKSEILWSVGFECGCDGIWSYCPNWKARCSLHDKKIVEIKAHTSWHNAWKYLFEKMEKYPKGIIFEEEIKFNKKEE